MIYATFWRLRDLGRLLAAELTTLVYRDAEMVAREFSLAGWASRRVGWLLLLGTAAACQRHAGASDQATEAAEQTFRTLCGRCHGADGKGGVAPEGVNAPRNFCDSAFQAGRTDEQLKQAIVRGKGAMPGFGNLFSDADLQGLVRKIRSFDPGAKKP
jgi:mono/diheme cytochrome c family protein